VPQKQPPAKTAVCFPGAEASEASDAAGGMGGFGAACAVHATRDVVSTKVKNERAKEKDI